MNYTTKSKKEKIIADKDIFEWVKDEERNKIELSEFEYALIEKLEEIKLVLGAKL